MAKIIKYIKNKFFKNHKKCYIIHSNEIGEFHVCKVLNIYDSKNKAVEDLSRLLSKSISEIDILENFNERKEL